MTTVSPLLAILAASLGRFKIRSGPTDNVALRAGQLSSKDKMAGIDKFMKLPVWLWLLGMPRA